MLSEKYFAWDYKLSSFKVSFKIRVKKGIVESNINYCFGFKFLYKTVTDIYTLVPLCKRQLLVFFYSHINTVLHNQHIGVIV